MLDNIKCSVLTFTVEKYHDLETRVGGHSRSLQITSLDRLNRTSYSPSIGLVTLALACTVSEIYSVSYEFVITTQRNCRGSITVYLTTARL